MPIPKPKDNEQEQEFVSRCVGELSKTDPTAEPKVRTAICYDAWRRAKGITASNAIDAAFSSSAPMGCWMAGAPVEENGQKVHRYIKGIIRTGSFFKESENRTFDVTPAVLSHWAHTFHKMRSRGVKVWIPSSHEEAAKSDQNRGWVDDMFVVDDTLFMSCRLIGNDANLAALRNDVSIYCPATWTDDGGEKYVMPIRHVALCPDPVVSDLPRFFEVAASSGKVMQMADGKKWWTAIAKELALAGDLTDETAAAEILKAIKSIKAAAKSGGVKASHEADNDSAPQDKPKPTDKGDEKVTVTEYQVSQIQLSAIADMRRRRIDGLVGSGHMVPNVAAGMKTRYVGEGNKALAMALSAGHDDGFDEVIGWFEANKPLPLGEATRAQMRDGRLMVLSTEANSDDPEDSPLVKDAMQRAKAAG